MRVDGSRATDEPAMKLERSKALLLLAQKLLPTLDHPTIVEHLSYYFQGYDNPEEIHREISEGKFPDVSDEIIDLVAFNDTPPLSLPPGVEPLLYDYLIATMGPVTNRYVQKRLGELGIPCLVEGEMERAGVCPCCDHRSIGWGEDGGWDICPVCFWENGGDGPNHMSLSQARKNFGRIGAMSERALEHIDPEGPSKYDKVKKQS